MAKTLRKELTFSYTRGPMSLGEAVREAERALEADYMADVNGVVEALKEKVKAGMGVVALRDAIDEMVGNNPRVNVTRKAVLGFIVSKNRVSAEDDVECEDEVPWSELMFDAMRQDVIDGLDEAGIDVSELGPTGGDDDEEEDDEDEGDDE